MCTIECGALTWLLRFDIPSIQTAASERTTPQSCSKPRKHCVL